MQITLVCLLAFPHGFSICAGKFTAKSSFVNRVLVHFVFCWIDDALLIADLIQNHEDPFGITFGHCPDLSR